MSELGYYTYEHRFKDMVFFSGFLDKNEYETLNSIAEDYLYDFSSFDVPDNYYFSNSNCVTCFVLSERGTYSIGDDLFSIYLHTGEKGIPYILYSYFDKID